MSTANDHTELGNKLFKFIFSVYAMLQISVFLSYVEESNYEKMKREVF